MQQQYEIKQVTPFVPVSNLDRSIEFYSEFLGFSCDFAVDNYAYIRREGAALRLIEVPKEVAKYAKEQSCYIDVIGLDALYSSLRPKLVELMTDQVRAPFNQDYGQREFHVKDPDGFLIFFGEAISK